MRCVEVYERTYNRAPEAVSFCPYRICPMGAHSDHQYGKVTGFAIDKGIHIAYGVKRNGVVELESLNFSKRAQFHVESVPEEKQKDWADYLRGATMALNRRYSLRYGISGVIEGSLPIGGLSSSAAVIISFLSALCRVNGICLTQAELIDTALHAETDYVGVSVGTLDQSCEIFSRKDHLLYLDTKDNSYELIPRSPAMKPFEFAIFFSGVERTLVGSQFNMRVDELKSAAYAMKGYAIDDGLAERLNVPYGRFIDARLRDVPRELYEHYKSRLPSMWRKRAEHFYTEFERVEMGAEAWRAGDIQTFGRLSSESGWSSIYYYETGSDELKTLYDILIKTDGVYGGRFSGAGFKGCCMALVDPAYREAVERQVTADYLKVFPLLTGRFSVHFCSSADGVRPEGDGEGGRM